MPDRQQLRLGYSSGGSVSSDLVGWGKSSVEISLETNKVCQFDSIEKVVFFARNRQGGLVLTGLLDTIGFLG